MRRREDQTTEGHPCYKTPFSAEADADADADADPVRSGGGGGSSSEREQRRWRPTGGSTGGRWRVVVVLETTM